MCSIRFNGYGWNFTWNYWQDKQDIVWNIFKTRTDIKFIGHGGGSVNYCDRGIKIV